MVDWDLIAKQVLPKKQTKIPYEQNKHKFIKIAFDVFQSRDETETLWTLECADDGQQYLAAMYEDDAEEPQIEAQGAWQAIIDKAGQNISLFYKEVPIHRFASARYGFDPEDAHVFKSALVNRLESDYGFVKKLLDLQTEEKKNIIKSQFPELA